MASKETEERRDRVRALWIHSDRQIAEILIEEGYDGARPRTAEARRKQVSKVQRNVWNDRVYWRETWRKQKRATSEDAGVSRGEYLATLDAYCEVGRELLTDPKSKGTPRVQALIALTRLAEAKAKATGVNEIEPPDDETEKARVPVIGLVLGTENISAEMREQLRAQGIDIDDDDSDEEK